MNIERITKLADTLEADELPLRFKMNDVITNYIRVGDEIPSGTAACIAGWACVMFGEKGRSITMGYAAELLAMPEYIADRLFLGNWTDIHLGDITRGEAVRELRRLAASSI